MSGLGFDENLVSAEWKKVVQRGNSEDAKREMREAGRVHLEREKRREGMDREREKRYCESNDESECSDLCIPQSPHKDTKCKCKSKPPKPENPAKGTPKWVIFTRRHCRRTHDQM